MSGAVSATGIVCHLRATNFYGGPEKQILEHCRHLDRGRWSPLIAVFREGRDRVDLARKAEAAGIDLVQIDTPHPFSLRAVNQLVHEIRQRGIGVLVTHGYKADVVGYLAARRHPVPLACCARGFTWEDWRVRLYERVDRFVLRRVGRVVAVSDATAALLAGQGVERGRIETIPNAIRTPERIEAVDLRSELGLPADAETLVSVGRLSPEKGHRVLVRAVERSAAERPRLHAVLIGDGKEEPALRAQVAGAGLEGRVHFAGFRDDVLGCMAGADLLVNPSHTEGMPNVLLEAFAAGCPVVATEVGGVAEVVADGVSGLLVADGDDRAMAAAISRLLDQPELARSMRESAGRRVRAEFSFEGQASRWMELYDRMRALPSEAGSRRGRGDAVGAANSRAR